jgi:alpha/beta hydrolase family protein
MGVPAWKSLPSWYLVATQDEAIPPDAERLFASRMGATTIEVSSSHLAMVSHPDEVTSSSGPQPRPTPRRRRHRRTADSQPPAAVERVVHRPSAGNHP